MLGLGHALLSLDSLGSHGQERRGVSNFTKVSTLLVHAYCTPDGLGWVLPCIMSCGPIACNIENTKGTKGTNAAVCRVVICIYVAYSFVHVLSQECCIPEAA